MKIVMNEIQYKELEDLVEIFDGMFFEEDEMQCFDFIKRIVDNAVDTENINKETKKKIKKQLNEAFEWLGGLNVNIKYKDKLISYF